MKDINEYINPNKDTRGKPMNQGAQSGSLGVWVDRGTGSSLRDPVCVDGH